MDDQARESKELIEDTLSRRDKKEEDRLGFSINMCKMMRRTMGEGEGIIRQQILPNVAGEAAANAMLAIRHIEDARMRLGKTIQALDGGISVYRDAIPYNGVDQRVLDALKRPNTAEKEELS